MPKLPRCSVDMDLQAGLRAGLRAAQLLFALVTMAVAAYGQFGVPFPHPLPLPPLAVFPEMGIINLLLQILNPGARTFWANLL